MATTDLKGTTWEVASGWETIGLNGNSFNVSGNVNKGSNTYNFDKITGTSTSIRLYVNNVVETALYTTVSFTITLTDGADTTNTSLIQWLETYGKLQVDTFQIPVDAPEGVRVLVKDTECKKDIDVIPVLQNKTITENGTYTAESGFAGFGEMIVDVPTPTPTTEKKTVTPSKSVQKVTATNADYLSEVTVEAIPSEYEIPVYFDAETDIEVV